MRLVDGCRAALHALVVWVGLGEVSVDQSDLRRIGILLLVCASCALFVVDYARAPEEALQPGEIAPRTVKAPFDFTYADHAEHERERQAARDKTLPVYVHRMDLLTDREDRISRAFAAGRERLAQVAAWRPGEPVPRLTEEFKLVVLEAFLEPLRVQLRESDLDALLLGGFSSSAEVLAKDLLEQAMRDKLIVLSRDQLLQDRRALRIIQLAEGERTEIVLKDPGSILIPEEARQQVSLGMLSSQVEPSPETDAAAALARALVTANVSYDPLQTEERREANANAVPLKLERVQMGQIVFLAGQVVTEANLDVYRALQEHQADQDLPRELLAIGLFLLLLLGSLYHFASTYLQDFSTQVRDVATAGGLLVFVALIARVVVASSEPMALMVGYEAEARAVWFLVPVAGPAMLVRLLLGVSWTVAFSVAAATICGLVMELQALPIVFFLISSVAAASAVEHTRERIAVLRAGALVGILNAITVLIIHFVQLFVVEGELSLATTMRPFWSMSFAFLGGILSSFLVLGLVPLLESLGFVTDYRLMELANLNHPLLRRLMLRAPGSYHHSVVVGTLAEAGCEAIGANSLLAKVASYFHDIGKSNKPQYFVENQRGEGSRHTGLDPHASASIIISHVTEGGLLAREHKLPQPIIDNIYMHHGTGVLQYFYASARERADDPGRVDIHAFRYPGPKPSTREAGVVMLADKVEAATRTLKCPDEHNIRSMIHRIVNSVIADGQFSECPLNLREIHTLTETFVAVLLGIYHQRIEYPQTADISAQAGEGAAPQPKLPPVSTSAMITLDLAPVQRPAPPALEGVEAQGPGSSPIPSATPVASAPRERSPVEVAKRPRVTHRPQSSQETPTPSQRRPFVEVTAPLSEEDSVVDYEALDYLPSGRGRSRER
ncbi:MAG TPA: HDIG domain-containing protein [Deltaproteobacteria bacterium]|nr:HDIG domain-containing protein [Deltaproteobacteria bacterium]